MDKKIKNYLGIAIIISLFIFALGTICYVYYYSKSIEPSSYRSFSVSGEGEVFAVPDVAKFSFGVITEGGINIADLQIENTGKVNRAIEFLKSDGIETKDIKTQNYNLSPRYQYYDCEDGPCPPPEIVGYTIRQTVEVKIRDFAKIGSILSGIVENGANSVSNLNFEIDDSFALQNEAREEAISKAKEKANAIAEAGGFKVGKLLSINEGYAPRSYYKTVFSEDSAMGVGAAPAPSIEPGSQEVIVTVSLTYEIK